MKRYDRFLLTDAMFLSLSLLVLVAIILAIMTVLLSSPLRAEMLRNDNATVTAVWRDSIARDEGNIMVKAGIGRSDPKLLTPLIECIVDNGTKVLVLRSSIMKGAEVLVLDGPYKGCRGNVSQAVVFD